MGYEIKDGHLSQKKYLEKRQKEIGEVTNVKELERVIGILSYARKVVRGTEKILGPLRSDLKKMKKQKMDQK